MPATSSGLSKPVSAASYARRRTAASRTWIVEAASFFASSCSLYRSTTARFKAKRGSEQYHSMNSSIACWYDLRDCGDVRLFRTDFFVWSSSGRVGRSVWAFLRFFVFIGGGLRSRRLIFYAHRRGWRVGLFSPYM